LGESFGEQFRPTAESLVEPAAKASGVIDEVEVGVFADGQTDGRTSAGQVSPPRCAG